MQHINLLPWRETLKNERQIRFGIIAGISVAFAGLVVLAVHMYMASEIGYQKSRNSYLEKQIKTAEDKITEIKTLEQQTQRLVKKMSAIQELEKSRPKIVHLFDEIVRRIPDGVYFTSMKQKGEKITLNGVAQSDARVTSLMKNLKRSEWLTNPTIYSITTASSKGGGRRGTYQSRVSQFKLGTKQTEPKDDAAK